MPWWHQNEYIGWNWYVVGNRGFRKAKHNLSARSIFHPKKCPECGLWAIHSRAFAHYATPQWHPSAGTIDTYLKYPSVGSSNRIISETGHNYLNKTANTVKLKFCGQRRGRLGMSASCYDNTVFVPRRGPVLAQTEKWDGWNPRKEDGLEWLRLCRRNNR